jgi:subtilisin family serine protease
MNDQMSDRKTSSLYVIERVPGLRTKLDPELQNKIIDFKAGLVDGSDEVDITAILKNPLAAVPGLNNVQQIGRVVTGTVKIADIAMVRRAANIFSLKSARRLSKHLKDSVPEIRASQEQLRAALPTGTPPINGSGVIVGVVDHGCDFVHRNFRNPDGTTRLLYLWDQNQDSASPPSEHYPYGREFDSIEINEALTAPDAPTAHQRLNYKVGADAHGTHVLDIAAGNGQATGNAGVAPQADIIFVDIPLDDDAPQEPLGNSRHLLEAVKYIFDKADESGQSAVVNVSLNTNGGPHDGSTPVEQGFDELLRTPGRAIVIAAGNSLTQGGHASGVIEQNHPRVLQWKIEDDDETNNKIEIWYGGTNKLKVKLITPEGETVGPFPLGGTRRIFRHDTEVARVFHRRKDPNNCDNQLLILLFPTTHAETWGISLSSLSQQAVDFHAWIEVDDDGQSIFDPTDVDRTFTIGSIACGKSTITVGSYAAKGLDLAEDTAQGPTRDNKQKPDVSAPGVDIMAARSLTQTVRRGSGTSAAAAHVTGLIALLMQAGVQAGVEPLPIEQIRSALISSARQDPPPDITWNSRYGYGRVNATTTVLTQIHPVSHPATSIIPPPNADSTIEDNSLQLLGNQ